MKYNKSNSTHFSDALLKEADGLSHLKVKLAQHNIPIKIPHIYSVDEQHLVLEHINHRGGSKQQWQQFGSALAQLHLLKEKTLGWHENNYIGLNPQNNITAGDWGTFFVEKRLAYQVGLIKDSKTKKQFKNKLSSIQQPLITFLNENWAFHSFLHGDLWSGNVLFDETAAWLIDPAVYCGDAEADLAMTELFGGFPAVFYQAYTEISPLSKHYALKKVIYNLYHQLNHYNLFGTGYLSACEQAITAIKKHCI